MKTYKGFLELFSETGTEGGFWAFMDENFIHNEEWNRDGLLLLKRGDNLTIYAPANAETVVWSGKFDIENYRAYSNGPRDRMEDYIQKGTNKTEWIMWFEKNYPAILVRK